MAQAKEIFFSLSHTVRWIERKHKEVISLLHLFLDLLRLQLVDYFSAVDKETVRAHHTRSLIRRAA